jgi:predicted HTH transcriptional regulator
MDLKSAHIELLLHGREERNLEYKTAVDFSAEPTKALLTRAIAAHANTRDGGNIVVGMEKNGESYERVGILVNHLATLKVDELRDYIRAHLTPTPNFTVDVGTFESKSFAIFSVSPFDLYPSVCIKGYRDEGAKRNTLTQGAFYVRARRKPESVAVENLEDLEDLIDTATDQWIQYRTRRDASAGRSSEANSRRRFAAEGEDL